MMKIGNINVRKFGLSDQFIEQYKTKIDEIFAKIQRKMGIRN